VPDVKFAIYDEIVWMPYFIGLWINAISYHFIGLIYNANEPCTEAQVEKAREATDSLSNNTRY